MLLDLAAGTVFPGNVPDGFAANRTLLLGLVGLLLAAFLAKLYFRTLKECRREHRDEQRELAATTGDGPPSFNG